jgi:hypothetical protein
MGVNMSSAAARHILVDSEEECCKLKSEIESGTDFAESAKKNSKCPSGAEGGNLGEFHPGQMVPDSISLFNLQHSSSLSTRIWRAAADDILTPMNWMKIYYF